MQSDNHFSWTLSDLLGSVEAVNGALIGALSADSAVRFTSISTDTRTLQAGALYIAIKGEQFDGHRFIDQAIQQGAVAILVSDTVDSIVPGVCVDDTRIALGLFAKWHREQMPVKTVIGVTGSNGKTTTKTLLKTIFEHAGKTLATEGNLNNDFGLPRTLLALRPDDEYAIIEMGANHPQEIAYLTDLAQPDIAMITNASGAHLEGFGSLQGVVDTKGEIFQGLNRLDSDNRGVAVINADSVGYADWQRINANLGVKHIVSFGTATSADVCVQAFKTTETGITFTLVIQAKALPESPSSSVTESSAEKTPTVGSYTVQVPVLGEHNAMNAAACVAVALSAGLSWSDIEPGLASFRGVAGRLQKQAIKTGWLIDDSYNANPESVKAGIRALVSLGDESILCLGAMGELGSDSEAGHQSVAEFAKQVGVTYLFVLGEAAQNMPTIFGENAHYFESHEAMSEAVLTLVDTKAIASESLNILVKGSRSAQMERIAEAVVGQSV
ncbi:MAG: UDP-N-acetylmuramoyl-tripeptide--D-alanyl-D-alanine ligase [Gammaproteobacteria bacterium]|nr:UDP-N-acetylmuramoyl-tripeptide--D-alanyl-D-alanine ligase [Gammaproteobacteria bacterium]